MCPAVGGLAAQAELAEICADQAGVDEVAAQAAELSAKQLQPLTQPFVKEPAEQTDSISLRPAASELAADVAPAQSTAEHAGPALPSRPATLPSPPAAALQVKWRLAASQPCPCD